MGLQETPLSLRDQGAHEPRRYITRKRMPVFDPDGNEILKQGPVGSLEHAYELGGQFERASFYLEFCHEDLSREEISSRLDLVPTQAWNAGERHPAPIGNSGITRTVDYGKWALNIDVGENDISDSLERFLLSCSAQPETWRELNKKWRGRIALVGHAKNWNREFSLSSQAVSLLAERGLSLNFDAYFEGADSDEQAEEVE